MAEEGRRRVKAGDVIAEIETDKATMEVEAVDEGTLGKILVAEGAQDVPVNQPIAVLLEEGEDVSAIQQQAAQETKAEVKAEQPAPPPAKPAEKKAEPSSGTRSSGKPLQGNGSGGRVFASPLARRLAREGGVDLARVKGSGPHGRVVRADIEAAKSGKAPMAAPGRAPAAPAVAPSMTDAQVMKLSRTANTTSFRTTMCARSSPGGWWKPRRRSRIST